MAKARWTPEAAAARLVDLGAAPEREATDVVAYRAAAAVLVWFAPRSLRPFGVDVDRTELPAAFADDCEPVRTPEGPRLALRADIRRAALAKLLAEHAIEAALAANPERPRTPAQRVLERLLLGRDLPDPLEPEELAPTLVVLEWLDGLVDLPPREAIRQRFELTDLLRPLKALEGRTFRGRQKELDRLRTYTGALRPEGSLARLKFVTNQVLSLSQQPPLVIYGIGGMGKSTLLAHFVLEHVELPPEQRFPFAYLDFDEPTVSAERPLALLAEILRQLGAQYLEARPIVAAALRRRLAAESSASVDPSVLRDAIDDISGIVREVGAGSRPFLLILDTFEEVEFGGVTRVEAVFALLDQLQESIPTLRTVIAGRSQLPPVTPPARRTIKPENMELGDLDRDAARGYLEARGLHDPATLEHIVSVVGANPLSLKLAAAVIQKAGTLNISPLRARMMGKERIRGVLYDRLLGHVHDPEVRQLAHPGLVLRLVMPAMIPEVLAGPCGIQIQGPAHAARLFEGLAAESTLVTREAEGLRHRRDVRRVMLAPLVADQPHVVDAIHRGAVAFHAARREQAPVHRAELVYHLCWLGDAAAAREVWSPDLSARLAGDMEEMPSAAQAILAQVMGVPLSEEARRNAGLEAWARDTELAVRDRLRLGRREDVAAARKLLEERAEWPDYSPLYQLEAEVLERLGDLAQAHAFAEAASLSTRPDQEAARADLLVLLGRIEERQFGFALALSRLEAAARLFDPARRLADFARALVGRARLLWRTGAPPEARYRLQSDAMRVLGDEVGSLPSVLRDRLEVVLNDVPRQWLTASEAIELTEDLEAAFPEGHTLDALLRDLGATGDDVHFGGDVKEVVFDAILWAEAAGSLDVLRRRASARNAGRSLSVSATIVGSSKVEVRPPVVHLDGLTVDRLAHVISRAFTPSEFSRALRLRLDVDLKDIAPAAAMLPTALAVIQWAEKAGRARDLVAAVVAERPDDPEAQMLAGLAELEDRDV